MNNLERSFLDTKTVALGIGAPERTLRSWVERDRFWPGGKKPDGRYEFSAYDLTVLSIVKPLAEFGVPVENAAYIAHQVLKESKGFKAALNNPRFDAPGIFSLLQIETSIRVVRTDDGGWRWNYASELEAQSAFIEIRVGFVVRDALRRAGLLKALEA